MELTIEKVYGILDNIPYTKENLNQCNIYDKKYTLDVWELTTKTLLNSFFPYWKIETFNENTRSFIGSRVYSDPKLEDKLFNNVTEFWFKSFYPNITSKLSNLEMKNTRVDIDPYSEENWDDDKLFSDKIIWNIVEFPILFDFILKNKESFRTYNNEKVDMLIKGFLNYTYGAINNAKSFIRCINNDKIASTGRKILNFFIETYPQHIIYADTDTIFFSAFEEIKNGIEEKMKEIDLPYEISNHLHFLFLTKKRYMIIDSDDVKFKGLKSIDNLREDKEKMARIREKIRERNNL